MSSIKLSSTQNSSSKSMLAGTEMKLSEKQLHQRDLQPTLNIGTLGHVAHGKSTLVRIISGISTQKHNKELERNMTIKLGYANAKIYKCPLCPRPQCYQSFPPDTKPDRPPSCKNSECTSVVH
eukprot:TRINITY_DN6706_c0_g1_i2.p1 TRINITY_DN6706_c0_g1~~TRINITY_DN6706_c0_g1_i2.p1  ORF type:complete len:123 (-),score=7.18 TRINITY_DN6706_c0_g1_i2:119-487(-)